MDNHNLGELSWISEQVNSNSNRSASSKDSSLHNKDEMSAHRSKPPISHLSATKTHNLPSQGGSILKGNSQSSFNYDGYEDVNEFLMEQEVFTPLIDRPGDGKQFKPPPQDRPVPTTPRQCRKSPDQRMPTGNSVPKQIDTIQTSCVYKPPVIAPGPQYWEKVTTKVLHRKKKPVKQDSCDLEKPVHCEPCEPCELSASSQRRHQQGNTPVASRAGYPEPRKKFPIRPPGVTLFTYKPKSVSAEKSPARINVSSLCSSQNSAQEPSDQQTSNGHSQHSSNTGSGGFIPRANQKAKRKDSIRRKQEFFAISSDMLLPLDFDLEYVDRCYHEPVKLVVERGTDADDGEAFIRNGIQPNISRHDDLIKADIHREDVVFTKGRVIPARPVKKWTRDAKVSIFSLRHHSGRNRYVMLTGDYDDELEFGIVHFGIENPVKNILDNIDSKRLAPVQMSNTTGTMKNIKYHAPLTYDSHHKGLAAFYAMIDQGLTKQTKSKRSIVLGTKYSKPLYGMHIIPCYCPGVLSTVKTVQLRSTMYTCILSRALPSRNNITVKSPKRPQWNRF